MLTIRGLSRAFDERLVLGERWPVKKVLIKVALWLVGLLLVLAVGGGIFVWTQVSAFDRSLAKTYSVPLREIPRAEGEQALARGRHVAESIGACASSDCHGADLAGGKTLELGPLGTATGPNITPGGLGAVYSDAELVRLIEHGVKKGGTSVRFMPSTELNWLPDEDLAALVAYLRSVPAVTKQNGPFEIGMLGKVLDRQGLIVLDVARKIDHEKIDKAPPPAPTAAYGKFIAKACMGCHGDTYGGGPIPGAPPEFATPSNITPHESGLQGYTYEAFAKLLDTGIKRDGQALDPFMALATMRQMNDTERHAVFEFLRTLPPKPFGSR